MRTDALTQNNIELDMSDEEVMGTVRDFIIQLHNLLPVLNKEISNLEKSTFVRGSLFKMDALISVYKAARPLYKWYVEKMKE